MSTETNIALPDAPDIVDRIAKEIGKTVAAHLAEMYPQATEAVAWSSCARSIEGVVRRAVAGAGEAAEKGEAEAWLRAARQQRLDGAARARQHATWRQEDRDRAAASGLAEPAAQPDPAP